MAICWQIRWQNLIPRFSPQPIRDKQQSGARGWREDTQEAGLNFLSLTLLHFGRPHTQTCSSSCTKDWIEVRGYYCCSFQALGYNGSHCLDTLSDFAFINSLLACLSFFTLFCPISLLASLLASHWVWPSCASQWEMFTSAASSGRLHNTNATSTSG